MKLFVTDREIERIKNEAVAKSKPWLTTSYTTSCEVERDTANAAFNFNDHNITVFTIKRIDMGNSVTEHTVIGYYFNTNFDNVEKSTAPLGGVVIRQWFLYCSRGQHNKLVEEFTASTKNKVVATPTAKKQLLKG